MQHAAAVPPAEPDFGPGGQAFRARPSSIVAIEGRSRGSVATERIEVRRLADSILADRLHFRGQLSDRQHAAAVRLGRLWTAAGLNPRVCGAYGARQPHAHQDGEEAAPIDAYRLLMLGMPLSLRSPVEAMLCEQHPGAARMDALHAGLDWLAEEWGIGDGDLEPEDLAADD